MRTDEQFPNGLPNYGDVSHLSVVGPRHAKEEAPADFQSPFETFPGLRSMLKDAADQLGITEFVCLTLTRSGPAAAVEREIQKGSVPAKRLSPNASLSGFVMSTDSAIRLLKKHVGVGGRFVADHLASRADLHECWTASIHTDFVDACAYHGDKAVFFVGSDFSGVEQYAENLDQVVEIQPNPGDP